MASAALHRWKTEAREKLDEIAQAHAAVGGIARGRRTATLQVNHAYAMLLSSHFQGFCRDLHTEAVDHLCASVRQDWAAAMLRVELNTSRKLDRGNPNPGNLGADFAHLGALGLWPALLALDARMSARQRSLDKLNVWRNAIAHQDFSDVARLDLGHGRVSLRLADVRAWRDACDQLAEGMDRIVGRHIAGLVGALPW